MRYVATERKLADVVKKGQTGGAWFPHPFRSRYLQPR